MRCNECGSELLFYAGLERLPDLEAEGYRWHNHIPDRFDCSCGKVSLDLSIFKRNFYALLGVDFSSAEAGAYTPLYDQGALDSIWRKFGALLSTNPREEVLQKYIEEHIVLLHQFPAVEIYFKPPILTAFKADFAVVTPQRELILIEIEKTTTRLLTKDGGVASELQHAFDQVHSWLHVIDEHRVAILDSIGIKRDLLRHLHQPSLKQFHHIQACYSWY